MQSVIRRQLGTRFYSAMSKKHNAFHDAVAEGKKGPVAALALTVGGIVVGINAYKAADKNSGIRGIYSKDRNI